VLVIIGLLLFISCADKPVDPKQETSIRGETGEATVSIPIPKVLITQVARVEAVVTAADMDTIRQDLTVSGDKATGVISEIPAGFNRLFTLNAYDANGKLIYSGSARAQVIAGSVVQVKVILRPVGGMSRPVLAYIATGGGLIRVFNTSTVELEPIVISIGGDPDNILFTSDGRFAYITDDNSGKISVLDTESHSVSRVIEVGFSVGGAALTMDGKRLYLSSRQGAWSGESDWISVIEASTGKEKKRISVPY
jgi:DNA-binding beta-propeller fold protein YncE